MLWFAFLLACAEPAPPLQPLGPLTVGQPCAQCEAYRYEAWATEWTVLPTVCSETLVGLQLTSPPLDPAQASSLQQRVIDHHTDQGWVVAHNVAKTLSAGAMGERIELHLKGQRRKLSTRLGARPGDPVMLVVQEGADRCSD